MLSQSSTQSLDSPARIGQTPERLDHAQALALAGRLDTSALMREAAALRDRGFGSVVTYSRKVFIPLTQLCRELRYGSSDLLSSSSGMTGCFIR